MNEDRTLVRASDLGLWAFCHRAWWLARIKDVPHQNPALLEHGTAVHAKHGAQLARSHLLQHLAIALLAAGLILGVIFLLTLVSPR